jgi:protein-L-isoaspartate(D-aspartate) O-methyltransferase
MRVLEVGAGTGYNAALLAALGARVVTVDAQADVAERAAAGLRRAGVTGVQVVHGDGYAGVPDGHVDRVIVTVGVNGLSPHWLGQVGAGVVLAPVRHAGTHPVLRVRVEDDGTPVAEPICPAGFMPASGPLGGAYPWMHPPPAGGDELPELVPTGAPRWSGPLEPAAYRDLWFATGVWHRRATWGTAGDTVHGERRLLDEDRTGGAVIGADGSVRAGGPQAARYAGDAAAVLDRWESAGRPRVRGWRGELNLSGEPDAPIWVPYEWRHQVPERRSRHGRPSGS